MHASALSIDRFRSIIVVVATAGMIAFNALAAAGYVGGVTPAVVSDRYPTILTPAGYAFSIWSLIYLGLTAFSIFQLSSANLSKYSSIRMLYVLSCALNCAWIFFFHQDRIGVCLVVITMLLGVLLLINRRLTGNSTAAQVWLAQAPFGLYFGWVTAATLINLMLLMKSLAMPTADSTGLGAAIILFAAGCAVIVRLKLSNFFYPLAIAWALTAIAVKQSGSTAIVTAAAVGVVTCLVTTGTFVVRLRDSTSG